MARTLYRSRTNRTLGGLCAGIAETYDLDPNAVRLAVVFVALITALLPCILTYLVAWMIVPEAADSPG